MRGRDALTIAVFVFVVVLASGVHYIAAVIAVMDAFEADFGWVAAVCRILGFPARFGHLGVIIAALFEAFAVIVAIDFLSDGYLSGR